MRWTITRLPGNQRRNLAIQRAASDLARTIERWLHNDARFNERLVRIDREFARGPMRELLSLEKRCNVRVL